MDHALGPHDKIVLTENDKPVARIVPDGNGTNSGQPGNCKGMLEIPDDVDDEILDMFQEYLP